MKDNNEYLIGAGGWAYFQVPGLDPLIAYSKAFNFVEVNSTFYEIPSLRLVGSWRRKVPENFNFSVRCHRSITHRFKFKPVKEAFEAIDKMVSICKVLKADILHMQTPPTLKFDEAMVDRLREFLFSASLGSIRIALEVRQAKISALPQSLIRLMRDLNVIHCVDLSREEPAFHSDILYSRLFGKGIANLYQFTDEELKEIDEKVRKEEHKKVVLCFHGVKMYKDAARFKIYKQTGNFPKVTRGTGLNSLKEVLSEDARFPATKQQLIIRQGWKVIDLTPNKRVHASQLLKKLPEKTFNNVEEVIQALKSIN